MTLAFLGTTRLSCSLGRRAEFVALSEPRTQRSGVRGSEMIITPASGSPASHGPLATTRVPFPLWPSAARRPPAAPAPRRPGVEAEAELLDGGGVLRVVLDEA